MSIHINSAQAAPAAPPELTPVRPTAPVAPAAVTAVSNDTAVKEPPKAAVSREELQEAIERLNEQVKKNSYNLNFSVDESSDYVVVKIRDANNGEVVRQIPNETVIRISEHFKGMLQDEKI